jgi:deoxyribodipyrimidine photo-lyase
MSRGKLLVYLLRRDLRVSDNPVLHHLATTSDHGFTHLLPLYVFPAHQIEVSGFLNDGEESPYPPARSNVGKFWRCGPHRAKFTAEAVWCLKKSLEELGSGLLIRIGNTKDVVNHLVNELKEQVPSVSAVWMTEEPSWEEVQEQESVSTLCSEQGIEFRSWTDEKFFVDE